MLCNSDIGCVHRIDSSSNYVVSLVSLLFIKFTGGQRLSSYHVTLYLNIEWHTLIELLNMGTNWFISNNWCLNLTSKLKSKHTEHLASTTGETTSFKWATEIMTESIYTSLSHHTNLINVLYAYLQAYDKPYPKSDLNRNSISYTICDWGLSF